MIMFNQKDNYIHIPIGKGLLIATKQEFIRMLERGKWYKRAQATANRERAIFIQRETEESVTTKKLN